MRRSVISLVAGVVVALMAVLLMSKYMAPEKTVAVQSDDNAAIRIVVAAKDLPFGTNIIRDYLEYAVWPGKSIPDGAFTNMDALLKDASGKGETRVVLRSFYAKEPILQQKISGFGDKATLSRKVSSDKRAFSIRVNDVSGVAGFLSPGDRVDIMLTRSPSGARGGNLVTDIILQNIDILGIDQLTDEATDKPILARTITVEVTTQQAQKLALAQQVGSLSLTLRNYSNTDEQNTGRITTGDLAAGVVAKNVKTSKRVSIRVRRGMDVN